MNTHLSIIKEGLEFIWMISQMNIIVVQRLLSQKRLGVVLSDRTLCLGIDLPIRSLAFSGCRRSFLYEKRLSSDEWEEAD